MSQSIPNPCGASVFGSDLIRVPPDVASIRFGVDRIEESPAAAFERAREGATQVADYLQEIGVGEDMRASRVTLTEEWGYRSQVRKFLGYRGSVSFHVVTKDLDLVDALVVGAIDAGANTLERVDFKTLGLKEFRVEARVLALQAARRKAEVYSTAAGVGLGRVTHIEDVNPDSLRRRSGHEPDLDLASLTDDSPSKAYDPGSIVVAAAVLVGYSLLPGA